jgi:hypothetical protein
MAVLPRPVLDLHFNFVHKSVKVLSISGTESVDGRLRLISNSEAHFAHTEAEPAFAEA